MNEADLKYCQNCEKNYFADVHDYGGFCSEECELEWVTARQGYA